MKKILILIAGTLAAAIVVVLGMASMQPATYHVERSVMTSATPTVVHRILGDLKRYSEWSPWEKLDPEMKKTIAGEPGTVGSSYAWDGNSQVGAGKMTFTGITPERFDIRLEFFRPMASTSAVSWLIAEEDGMTKVTWAMDGNNESIAAKAFSMFVDMDKMLGKDFDNGLAVLKTIAEQESF
jgi:hypothetical protein